MLNRISERKIFKLDLTVILVIFSVLIYSIVFSYYTIMKHYSFRSYTWDLGILIQSLKSATMGKPFINNVELYYSPSGSYFGVHFAPILFILLPFFYLLPKVETILVIQSIAIALGAISIYLLSENLLNDKVSSMMIAISYLLNPSLQGINWYDFHTQSLFPMFILTATYFLNKRRVILFLTFFLMSLMILEQSSFLLIIFLLYISFNFRCELINLILNRKFNKQCLIPFITLIIIICWIQFSTFMINIFNPFPPRELKAVDHFRILDIKDPIEIPIKAITNLDLVLKAVKFDLPFKIMYIVLNFAPTCFISILEPLPLLPALGWMVLSILSNYPPYYQIGFQYPAFIIPFIYIGTIEAIKNIIRKCDKEFMRNLLFRLSLLIFLASLVLSLFISPLSLIFEPREFSYFRDYGISVPSSVDVTVRDILNTIPEDATILTTATLFPHVSTNINAYTIPPINTPSEILFEKNLKYLKNLKYEYILISYFWDKKESELIYNEFIKNNGEYGLFLMAPGLELYKLHHNISVTKVPLRFSSKELFLGDSIIVNDPSSESGKVIMLKASSIANRYAWFGPYITLVPDNYTVTFKIKTDKISDGKILKLDIWSNFLGRAIGAIEIFGGNFSKAFTWQKFTLRIEISDRIPDVEFRGLEVASDVTIWLDYVEVIPG